ncbi:hypothetical protein RF11_11503 [Thelohanellus kitauei]|uniref:RxLR effector protein n=1 Tax=Thelohanellus kitauei TaxID=669202 RepID=A0A0C2NBP2_THEKT|nr:hypothetical protein RF11_11503 [Thelohanellus kitauei]
MYISQLLSESMYWIIFLCLQPVLLTNDKSKHIHYQDFLGSGFSLDILKTLLDDSDFILNGQLGPMKLNKKHGYFAEWLSSPSVLRNTQPGNIPKYVLFGQKPENKLPKWNNKYPLIVFGTYLKLDSLPKVKAMLNINNGMNAREFYEKLVEKWAEFDLEDALRDRSNLPRHRHSTYEEHDEFLRNNNHR